MKGRELFVALMVARFGRDRWNEHVKAVVNLLNAISAACFIGAVIAPLVNGTPGSPDISGQLLLSGVAMHLLAQFVLRYVSERA